MCERSIQPQSGVTPRRGSGHVVPVVTWKPPRKPNSQEASPGIAVVGRRTEGHCGNLGGQKNHHYTRKSYKIQEGVLPRSIRKCHGCHELAAEITGIDVNFIYCLKVILETLSIGHNIDTETFSDYIKETAELYVNLYPWHRMTQT
ncbi:hypothetical protein PR048_024300 [Dryococelus australis]|uniref:Uncharacterized protein n=1 Tax=Dryococelus australis TaxID=614101 RepID=A0ABQ9GN76_9NEOP|nr:hypothetical protein PR048_024300 [Dryococelus australis]